MKITVKVKPNLSFQQTSTEAAKENPQHDLILNCRRIPSDIYKNKDFLQQLSKLVIR